MPEQKRPVTVEDLIRLKRAEHPPAGFWDDFDRELRAKQLAALVEKRPWWQTMPRAFTGWRRYYLPLGATAVLAITFLSLRDDSEERPAAQNVRPAPVAASLPEAGVAKEMSNAPSVAVAVAEFSPASAGSDVSTVVAPKSEPATVEAISPGELSRMVALVSETPADPNSLEAGAPSARYMAANLAAATPVEPSLARSLLVGASAVESRSARGAVLEPLAQITPPAEARRARFISAMAVAAIVDMTGRSAEREARKLSDDRLNDHVRRFNVKANSLSMKL